MCRVHRIGQTKPVTVTYLDAAGTFDEAVKVTCEAKEKNAELILLDGKTSIGPRKPESMIQTAGVLCGETRRISEIRSGRADHQIFSSHARSSGAASKAADLKPDVKTESKTKAKNGAGGGKAKMEPVVSLAVPSDASGAASSSGPAAEIDLCDSEEDMPKPGACATMDKPSVLACCCLPSSALSKTTYTLAAAKRQASPFGFGPSFNAFGGSGPDEVHVLSSSSDNDTEDDSDDAEFTHEVSHAERDAAGRAMAIDVDDGEEGRGDEAGHESCRRETNISQLVAMGFGRDAAAGALAKAGGQVDQAVTLLAGH